MPEVTNNVIATNVMAAASMDIETALLAVQSKRAELLETQLRSQIEAVQAKNDQITKLNAALGELNSALPHYKTETDGDYKSGFNSTALDKALLAANVGRLSDNWNSFASNGAGQTASQWTDKLKRNDIDAAITKVKGLIDSLGNSQQMDTLRLQSLSAKRNEAFEQMTNWMKKMQDVRSNIIGNMR